MAHLASTTPRDGDVAQTAHVPRADDDDVDTDLRRLRCGPGGAARGAAPFANADGVHYPGTYIAGPYDRLVTTIQGHDVANEDLVNLPNWLSLSFRLVSEDDPDGVDHHGDQRHAGVSPSQYRSVHR